MMMNDAMDSRFAKGPLFGLMVMVTGGAVLVGWGLDIPSLKSVLPGFVTTKTNTAVGFVLAGLSLALLARAAHSGWSRWLSRACAGVTVLLGLLSLGEYLLGIDFGIDQLLFVEPAGEVGTLAPNRMAPATAANFVLVGIALWLVGFRRTIPIAQRLSLLIGLMGLLPLLGYLYGAPNLYGMGYYTQLAVPTAVAFVLLSVGVLVTYPMEGLMRTVSSDVLGGWLLRRLVPFVVGVPLVLGWIMVRSQHGGYIEVDFAVALMMVVIMLLLSGVTWRAARTLNRIDIARRRAETHLAENGERLRATLYGIGDGVISTDREERVMQMNPVAELLTGWTEGEALGKALSEIFHIINEHTRLKVDNPVAQVLRDGRVVGLANHTVLIARDGSERLIADSGAPIHNRQGAIVGVVLVFRDRTSERAAQDAARKSEERLQQLIKLAPIPMSFIGQDGVVNYLNDRFVKVLGYTRGDIPTLKEWWSSAYPDQSYRRQVMRSWESAVQEAARTGMDIESAEYRVTCKDGTERLMDVSGVVLGDNILVTLADVTERKEAEKQVQAAGDEARRLLVQAEQSRRALLSVVEDQKRSETALRESEERFRKVFEEGQMGMALTDPEYRYTRVNAAFCGMLGYSEVELKSRRFVDVTHPDDVGGDIIQAQELKEGKISFYRREKRYLRKDQAVVWGAVTVSAMRDGEGRYLYAVAMIEDITERKQAEEERVRRNNAAVVVNALAGLSLEYAAIPDFMEHALDRILSLEWLAEESKGSIFLADPKGKTLHLQASKGFSKLLLASCSTVPFGRCLCGRAAAERAIQFASCLDERHQTRYPGMAPHGHYCVPILSGDRVLGVINLYVREGHRRSEQEEEFLKAVAGKLAEAVERKRATEALREANRKLEAALDEVKRTQLQVVQQERLSALGKMASGIAHDFNNLLVPLLGYSEILLNDPDILNNRAETKELLTDMHTAAKDGRDLVKRLREFYRPNEAVELEETDLVQLIKEAVSLTEPRWKPQARAKGASIRVAVEADHLPMVQCGRAQIREALMNLIFNAVDAMPAGGAITLRAALQEDHVIVSVHDTGTGMSEEVRRRCFEPFFSTKGGKGTGMGLAMVYGVVQRHGGTVEVESEEGKGTTVTIRLPMHAAGEGPGSPAAASPPIRPLRILVVDDEVWALSLLSRYLKPDGHTVETANGGGPAIDKLKSGRFDLVITDRAMPDMSGDRVAKEVVERWPQTPVILLTGFGEIMQEQGEVPEGVTMVLGKPVTRAELRKAIEKVIL